MRFLKWLAVLLVLLAAGGWFGAKVLIEKGAAAVFEDMRRDGLTAETTALSVGGFPLALTLRAEGVQIADPVSGAGWQAPALSLSAPSYAPWALRADLPPDQVVTTPAGRFTLLSEALVLTLTSAPATDLPLRETSASATRLEVQSDQGWTVSFGEVFLRLTADDTRPPGAYGLAFDLAPFQPPQAFREALAQVALPDLPAPDFPDAVEIIRGQVGLHFDAPLALNGAPQPALTTIEVIGADVGWGALALHAEGKLEADAEGFAAGRIQLQLTNWDRLPALLVAAGAVKPEIAPTIAGGLRALAAQSPDPAVLTLPLSLAEGRMALGPFPLGEAPRLRPPGS